MERKEHVLNDESADERASKKEEGRHFWLHEDNLINHRLTWLGVTQGLLFGALFFILKETSGTGNPLPSTVSTASPSPSQISIKFLVKSLPWFGLFTSGFIFVGVSGAIIAMCRIKKLYELPRYGVSLLTTLLGWTCAIGIAATFVAAWVIVLCNR